MQREREGNTPFLLQIIFYSWIFISFLFFFLPSLLEELSVSSSSSFSFSRLDSRDGANETFPLPLTSSPYVAGGKEESVKRLHANKLYLSIHLRRTLCLSPRNWQSNVKLIFSTLPSVISIRWKFQFFFFFFTRAKKGRRSRIPLHGDSLSEQFLENSSFLSPFISFFFLASISIPRFNLATGLFLPSRWRLVLSLYLSFFFFFFSFLELSKRDFFEWITDNEIIMNEEEFTRESTRARFHEFRRIYERIDETFLFGKISLELERIYPRGAIFLEKGRGRIGYVKTWISRSRTTTIRFLFACFFRRTSVVLFFRFLFKEVISPDDKLSERRNSRIQRSSTPLKKKRRKRRYFQRYSTLNRKKKSKERWKKNVFVKYGRKGTIPVFLGWWKVSSTMTETSPGDEEKLGRSLFHRSCIRTIPGEKSGGKCVYHSKLLIPNEWMERREENTVRFRKRKREKEDSISTLRILREIRGLEGIRV